MLTVACFLWRGEPADKRTTYAPEHVMALRRMVGDHMSLPHDFVCLTDHDRGDFGDGVQAVALPDSVLDWPKRYPKLLAFSPSARSMIGPRFLLLDLDVVVLDDLTPLVSRPEPFVVWKDPGSGYNTSMILMDAGARPKVWSTFDPKRSPSKVRSFSDQGWVTHVLGGGEATWDTADGVLSYKRNCRKRLPANARIVFFHGKPKPWDVKGWPKEAWHGRG